MNKEINKPNVQFWTAVLPLLPEPATSSDVASVRSDQPKPTQTVAARGIRLTFTD